MVCKSCDDYGHCHSFDTSSRSGSSPFRLLTCGDCGRFYLFFDKKATKQVRVVFVDGSCLNNGQYGKPNKSGIGVATGSKGAGIDQWAIPVDETVDGKHERSCLRAEILAALEGVKKIERDCGVGCGASSWVVATDSLAVVTSMTRDLPFWKSNDWKTVQGTRPSACDLYQALDTLVEDVKAKCNIRITFLHISRKHNKLADSLARAGAADIDSSGD